MTVSIITATYNSEATVADTIVSVQQQTYPAFEHLIIDGVSTDQTLAVVRKRNNPNCFIHSQKDQGIYDAMNRGIGLAKGTIIGILNSDDFYANNEVLADVAKAFETHNCDAVYGDLLYVNAKNPQKITRTWKAGNYRRNKFLYGWMPPHPTFFVKREVYEKYGLFNLMLGSAADYELMLRFLYKHHLKVAYIPKVLVHMRQGGVSNKQLSNRIAANRNDKAAWRINSLEPRSYTLLLKPLRKLPQFLIR